MDIISRACFVVAGVILLLASWQLSSVRSDVYRRLVGDGVIASYDFEMLHAITRFGITPMLFAGGVLSIGFSIRETKVN